MISSLGLTCGVTVMTRPTETAWGVVVTVEADWAEAPSSEGRLLRYAHGAACSHFTTVLGPEANAQHHDHFHVDLGCHGKTCTARLCE